MEYIFILRQAIVWTLTIYWIYQVSISLCSLIKIKTKKIENIRENKFIAVIPAHNEEQVVGNLIDSLQNQTYDKDKYDIYVIADNCTDNTAQIAKDKGVFVYERFDSTKKTKGYALDWFLNQILDDETKSYDALLVFDADNIADKNFITQMNIKLNEGEEVVQGYRDIKNPTDSWVSSGYAIFYWMMHRFYHLARYNIGLSPLLNGTGFMVKWNIIEQTGGWKTKTLTEDIEFSLQRIIEGKKLGWATDAIVYDEQPVDFKQSWKQRTRWSVGHIQCIEYYTKQLFESAKQRKTLMNFDGLLYIVGSIPMFILSLIVLLLNVIIYNGNGFTQTEFIINILMFGITTFIYPIISALIVMALDKKPIKQMIKGIICYPLFLGSWLLINFKCLFKRDITWEKIEHIRDIKIENV